MGDGEYLWPVAAPAAAARRSAAGELLNARTVSREESWLSAGPEPETGSGRGSDPEPVPEAVPEFVPEFELDLLLESAPSCEPSAPATAAKPTRGSEPICICICICNGMLLLKSSAEAPLHEGGRGGGGGNGNEEETVSGEGTAGCVAVASDRNPYAAADGVATTAVVSELLGYRLWLWFGFRLRLGFGEMERNISRAPGFRLATATVSIGRVTSGEKCAGYVGICDEVGICCGAYAVAQYAAGILIMPAVETTSHVTQSTDLVQVD